MKNILMSLSALVLLATFAPVASVAAQDACSDNNPATKCDVLQGPCATTPEAVACQQRDQTPENNSIYGPNGVITKAASLIAMLVGIAAVIVIIIAGLTYILSSGDPAKVTQAKNMILYAVVGIVVALLAQSIVIFVLRKL